MSTQTGKTSSESLYQLTKANYKNFYIIKAKTATKNKSFRFNLPMRENDVVFVKLIKQ